MFVLCVLVRGRLSSLFVYISGFQQFELVVYFCVISPDRLLVIEVFLLHRG